MDGAEPGEDVVWVPIKGFFGAMIVDVDGGDRVERSVTASEQRRTLFYAQRSQGNISMEITVRRCASLALQAKGTAATVDTAVKSGKGRCCFGGCCYYCRLK